MGRPLAAGIALTLAAACSESEETTVAGDAGAGPCTPSQPGEVAALASPIMHVDPSDRPQLLVQGGADGLVLPEQGRCMQVAFEGAGVPSSYLELAEEPHAFELITDESAYRSSTCTTLAYLAAVLDGPPAR